MATFTLTLLAGVDATLASSGDSHTLLSSHAAPPLPHPLTPFTMAHMATFLLTLLAGAGATLASSVSRRAAIPAHVARGAVPAPASRRRRRRFGFGSSSSHCRKPLAHTRRCCRLRRMWQRFHSRCLPALTPPLLLVPHAVPLTWRPSHSRCLPAPAPLRLLVLVLLQAGTART